MISSIFSTSLGLPSSLFYSQLPGGRVGCHETFLLPASSYRKAPLLPLAPPERRAGLERYFFPIFTLHIF